MKIDDNSWQGMGSIEIKLCPFCKAALPYLGTSYGSHKMICPSCGAQGPKAMTESMAVKLWNEGVTTTNEHRD